MFTPIGKPINIKQYINNDVFSYSNDEKFPLSLCPVAAGKEGKFIFSPREHSLIDM